MCVVDAMRSEQATASAQLHDAENQINVADFIFKAGIFIINYAVGPETFYPLQIVSSRSGNNKGAAPFGKLNRQMANTARSTVDEPAGVAVSVCARQVSASAEAVRIASRMRNGFGRKCGMRNPGTASSPQGYPSAIGQTMRGRLS